MAMGNSRVQDRIN